MTMSFRTRLFGVASVVVAVVLTAVLVLGWSRVLKSEVERLEDRLCMEARRLGREPRGGERLDRLEADMAGKLRLTSSEQLMLRFEPHDGRKGLQSRRWEAALNVDAMKWARSGRPAEPDPARRQRRGPRVEGGDPVPGQPEPDRALPRVCELASFVASGSDWRAARIDASEGRSFVAADLAATKAEVQGDMRDALQWVIPMALALVGLGAWLLASMTMRPVNRLREAMTGVTQRALDQRLPTHGEDREFQQLIDAYNTMLERLEASFQQASRFSADAAHELKTPLTILRGRIERAINEPNDPAAQLDLTNLLDEVGRLAAITRKLLLLSQADAGQLALNIEAVDLTDLLNELVSDAQLYAVDRKVSSVIESGLVARADSLLLRQLLNNLVSNAVRYGQPGGSIEVIGRTVPTGIEVRIMNSTAPISTSDRQRFFQRFYRGDPSHGCSIEGSGLGLSLAREIARAHGGALTLEPSRDDEVRFKLTLPTSRAMP